MNRTLCLSLFGAIERSGEQVGGSPLAVVFNSIGGSEKDKNRFLLLRIVL